MSDKIQIKTSSCLCVHTTLDMAWLKAIWAFLVSIVWGTTCDMIKSILNSDISIETFSWTLLYETKIWHLLMKAICVSHVNYLQKSRKKRR